MKLDAAGGIVKNVMLGIDRPRLSLNCGAVRKRQGVPP